VQICLIDADSIIMLSSGKCDTVCVMLSTIFIPVLMHCIEDACGQFLFRLFNITAFVGQLNC
jgi:hypothetical protein